MNPHLSRSALAPRTPVRSLAGRRVLDARCRGRNPAASPSTVGDLFSTLGAVLTRHSAHYGRPHLS